MSIDDIIEQVGGIGPFQIYHVLFVYGFRILLSWSMMVMSFAGITPDWWCVPLNDTDTYRDLSVRNNDTFEVCPSAQSPCSVIYSDDMSTVVSEWGLICDKSTLSATITSIQMAGVLVGALIGGQIGDSFGRKRPHFFSVLLHGVANIIAAFSVSWHMFAVLRFFIGMALGMNIGVASVYVIETFGVKQRSIVLCIPMWVCGTGIYSLTAWLKPSWFYQHITIAALHLPFLLGWFVVPEGLRWLTISGRIDEAEAVVDQMSRWNRKSKPENTAQILKQVAEEERRIKESRSTYTYLDVYRPSSLALRSVVMQFIWICISLVFYGITFGVASLAGNVYLNIFLLGVVELPGTFTLFYCTNTFGRRWTVFMYLLLASLSAFSVTLVDVYESEDRRGVLVIVFAMACKLGIGASWGGLIMIVTEMYPTVIRNLGSGATNTMSRIGGIISPFVFGMKKGEVFVPFLIVGSLMGVCTFLCLLLEETKGRPLPDTITKTENSRELPDIKEGPLEKALKVRDSQL